MSHRMFLCNWFICKGRKFPKKNQLEKIITLMMTEDDNHSSVGTCTAVLKVKGFVIYV